MSLSAVAEYKSFKVQFETKDGIKFWAVIDEGGIAFYDRVSSSGWPEGNPIVKTPDDMFEWIDEEGARKPFRSRSAIMKQRQKS